jgi:hypothetical protein
METRYKLANVARYGERALDPEFDPKSLEECSGDRESRIERNADTRRGRARWRDTAAKAKPRKKLLLERLIVRNSG